MNVGSKLSLHRMLLAKTAVSAPFDLSPDQFDGDNLTDMRLTFILSLVVVATLSFMAGQGYQRLLYEDICLDMGGGHNPGNHPICVIENPNRS